MRPPGFVRADYPAIAIGLDRGRAAAPEVRDEPRCPRNFGKISAQFHRDFGRIS